jgi:hypothetical protein
MAANIESITLLVGAWFLGRWLDEWYPLNISWIIIVVPVGIFMIFRTWVILLKRLLSESKKERDNDNNRKNLK